jgi:hypothetical protein
MSCSHAVTIVRLATHGAYPRCSDFDSRCLDQRHRPTAATYSGEAMDNAYMSAIAALAGSAIGAVASLATTWLTQHAQERAQRFAQAMSRREHLYGEFIEEASRLFSDALTHEFDDPSKFVRLYALVGKLRLFASAKVISKAEEVMQLIVDSYDRPIMDVRNKAHRQDNVDVLRAFSEACREDLGV